MNLEETIRKLTDAANELFVAGAFHSARKIFYVIDEVCDSAKIEVPAEAVSLNIELDDHFGLDIFRLKIYG